MGGRASGLSEYSNRQWAGLIEGYYMPRWKMYFEYILECHNKGLQIKWADIDTQILDWEWHWVNSTKEKFATKAKGNTLEIAQKLFQTYYLKMLQ
ncbi:alpha-N-acetylglucosaminidase C-terminal domain-containing protein [Rhizosphaericola mali]|uniref:alpha-N-acetylglucosaminidase C-terminal domain-containing protein n=1 Tax=Rhizosphaericola mali TaxID=2545455 RepID=UPI002102280C|nr:alpha-N-acetylglucosaminidase C-terminal domain-containing protein [Rhizosphaericola mali]